VATVSRVLNNDKKVSAKTRMIVEEAIKKLDYRPNLLGRNLRLRKTQMILVILDSIANNFHAKLVHSIEEEARSGGYAIMLCPIQDDRKIEAVYLDLLRNKMADGIIFLTTTLEAREMLELGREYPVIQCGEYREGTGVPVVSIDNEKAAYAATKHLTDAGRKRVAHITVANLNISTRLRLAGYRAALADAGLPAAEERIAYARYGYRSAYAAMARLLELETPPDAVFAISDRMAAGAIKCAIDRGFRVPEDIAVIGFDNTDISPIYNPGISSVSQSEDEMGRTAVRILFERIQGCVEVPFKILDYKLIPRASTGA
jgi:DNA-binding LacI/PurR family transcriptional regulator